MTAHPINVLSIAPYQFIPLRNGGHQAIAKLHHYLGQHCNDHIVSTDDNDDNTKFSFTLHKIFPDIPLRYFPGYGINKMLQIAKSINCTHIICEHPYMAISAMTMAHKLNVPWFIRSHNIEAQRFRALGKAWWPILKKYEGYAMRKSDGVFFITQEDADYAHKNLRLPIEKCHTIPFGTDLQQTPQGMQAARQTIAQETGIDSDVPWLYFLGALDYPPNEDAVSYILNEVQPRLKQAGITCEILIAGKGLNEKLVQQTKQAENTHYLGYVSDLDIFLKSCNVMLNPVLKGGGIKTKAVEALGYNKTVVSSISGAAGITPNDCGEKLLLSADYDWDAFVQNILKATHAQVDMPNSFYETYYHGNIAAKIFRILQSTR